MTFCSIGDLIIGHLSNKSLVAFKKIVLRRLFITNHFVNSCHHIPMRWFLGLQIYRSSDVVYAALRITILDADQRRIKRMRLQLLSPAPTSSEAEKP